MTDQELRDSFKHESFTRNLLTDVLKKYKYGNVFMREERLLQADSLTNELAEITEFWDEDRKNVL